MRLSLRSAEGHEFDVEVSGADPSITVGDLFAAAGLSPPNRPTTPVQPTNRPLADGRPPTLPLADGQRCSWSTPLAALDLPDGAVIECPGPVNPANASPSSTSGGSVAARLVVVAGRGVGRRLELPVGVSDLTIGPPSGRGTALIRADVAGDGTVRLAALGDTPALLDGRPADDQPRPASWLAVADTVFSVERALGPTPAPARTGTGRTPFVRAPRVFDPDPEEPVTAPTAPGVPREPEPLSWVVLVLPIPMAVAMAVLFNSPLFLMFAFMSPITALGRRWDAGRRRRRAIAENEAQLAADAERLSTELGRRRDRIAERRRTARPQLATLAEQARTGDPALWRSRSTHDDFLKPVIGVGPDRWTPTVMGDLYAPELEEVVAQASVLPLVPVTADLRHGVAIGIVGPASARRCLAASLLAHLTTEHGPGDLILAAFLDPQAVPWWDHLKWLPHLVDEAGARRVATSIDAAEALAGRLLTEPERQHFTSARPDELELPVPLVLVDSAEAVRSGVQSLASRLPRTPGRAIVLADTVEALPAFCSSIAVIDSTSDSVDLVEVATGRVERGLLGNFGAREPVVGAARSLARFVDPDSPAAAATLPNSAVLSDLLGVDPTGESVAAAWGRSAGAADRRRSCRTLLGAGEREPMEVDLLADGPHALVAGTTGAGKSELLRTMIVSLAARYGPDEVTFVLVDFKGGGAFDVFADLPHNVGVVTDLDEHLAARALRCLQAELKYREHRLRAAGVSDLVDLPRHRSDANDEADGPTEPLPRLIIVVDEFATLAAELPDFMASLVDVAQRGRSLGIHMVLATQRPTGVVDAKIRANTNLRIALRVQDDADSADVIGSNQAAGIDRRHPGRAFARFGAGELVGFQTALVSVHSAEQAGPALGLDTFELVADPAAGRSNAPIFDGDGPDDLARYVQACQEATQRAGLARPRVPWPDPLPTKLAAEPLLAEAPARPWATPMGLVDLPDEQCQATAWWGHDDGNVVVYGIEPGAASGSVATLMLGLAARHSTDAFHLYVLDFAGALSALRPLPHVGGFVTPDDDERLLRTLQLLEDEVDRRRRLVSRAQLDGIGPDDATTEGLGEAVPLVAVAIANYSGVLETFEELGELGAATRLAQIVRDGPAMGVFVFVASSSERDVPNRVGQQIVTKYVMRMADPNAYMMFGLRAKDVPELGPGRAIDTRSGLEVQFARFGDGDLRRSVEQVSWTVGHRGPKTVEVLGDTVPLERVGPSSALDSVWRLAIGLSAADLGGASLEFRPGRHAVVTGPSGSGRTSTLRTLAAAARRSDPEALLVLATTRPDEWPDDLRATLGLVGFEDLLACDGQVLGHRRVLVLIDGSEQVDLPEPALEQLAAHPPDRFHLVVSGRPDGLRVGPPWIRSVLSHRTGVALAPAPEHGDLFRCRFPTPRAPLPPGRGYLVNEGIPDLAQVALVEPDAPEPIRPDCRQSEPQLAD
jgi:S-DNA-T family DNA segregation ATPase FtsK/SpoIIIE